MDETDGRRGADLRAMDGFALLTVVWAITLVSLCATIYMTSARTRSVEASAAVAHAKADAAARAGMMLGLAELVAAYARNPGAVMDDASLGSGSCRINDVDQVRWTATSESGRVDLNSASEELMEALLRGTADRGDDWLATARAIARARDDMRAVSEAGKAPAFRSSADLTHLAEMSPTQYRRLRPYITVHSGRPGLHPDKASPDLLALIADRGRSAFSPALFVADVPGHVYRLVSEATLGSGVARHRAIVEINPEPPVTFAFREWRDGVDESERVFSDRTGVDCGVFQPR